LKVRLEIGTLVLDGFDYHDHKRIADAMKVELARLVAERGLGEAVGRQRREIARAEAPSFPIPTDKSPRSVGKEIARSVYASLKR